MSNHASASDSHTSGINKGVAEGDQSGVFGASEPESMRKRKRVDLRADTLALCVPPHRPEVGFLAICYGLSEEEEERRGHLAPSSPLTC